MKKILVLSLILIILAVGIGSVFAMTAEKPIPQPTVFVIEVKGQAEIKKSNSQEWIELKAKDQLTAGDQIRTGNDSQVSINFYDNSTSRIGPNTEISCDQLFIDDQNYAKTKVGLVVTMGRVWSRIIQLSDREASFEVGSNKTVATVRGTAFDFEVTAEGVANINAVEGIVEVSIIQTKKGIREVIAKIDLLEGLATTIDQRVEVEKLRIIETKVIPEARKESQWYLNNIKQDKRFKEAIEEKQAEIIEQIAGILPDSNLYGFKKMAENVRLTMTNDLEVKEKLRARFASRRLAEIHELIKTGKAELTKEMIQEFQKKAKQLFGQEETRTQITNQINLQENILREVTSNKALYELKRDLEDLKIDLVPESEKDFLRFKQIQERLKEADSVKETEFIEQINLEKQIIDEKIIDEIIKQDIIEQNIVEDVKEEPILEKLRINEIDKETEQTGAISEIIEQEKQIIDSLDQRPIDEPVYEK